MGPESGAGGWDPEPQNGISDLGMWRDEYG